MSETFYIASADQITAVVCYIQHLQSPHKVEIKPLTNGKIEKMRRKFHAIRDEIAETLEKKDGIERDKDSLKADLKANFGIVEVKYSDVHGKKRPYLKSTTKYSEEEWAILIGACDVYLAELLGAVDEAR